MLVRLSNLRQPSVSGDKTKTNEKIHAKRFNRQNCPVFFCGPGSASWLTLRGVCQRCEERKRERIHFHWIYYRWGLKTSRCGDGVCDSLLASGNRTVMTYGLMPAILFIYIGCGREHLFKVFVALMKFVQAKVHYLWKHYPDQFWVQTTTVALRAQSSATVYMNKHKQIKKTSPYWTKLKIHAQHFERTVKNTSK